GPIVIRFFYRFSISTMIGPSDSTSYCCDRMQPPQKKAKITNRHAPREDFNRSSLLRYVHRSPGRLPIHTQGARCATLIKGNREIFLRGGQLGDLHVDAREIGGRAGVIGAPLAGSLADDQGPLGFVRNGEKRVATSRYSGSAYGQVGIGDKCGGFIGSGAPDLVERHDPAENLAPFGARTGGGDRNRTAARQS